MVETKFVGFSSGLGFDLEGHFKDKHNFFNSIPYPEMQIVENFTFGFDLG